MARDPDEFDPTAPENRGIGREMVDRSAGLGSAIAHLYRGEVDREISWRERMDATTNWAVTVIAGILAYAFSSDDVAHTVVLAGMLIGVVFLLIETRRFQRYNVWRSRVRSMQENLFANALDPSEGVEQRDWRRQLSETYRDPEVSLPLHNALAHRLRRVYLPLLCGLLVVWLIRLSGADEPTVAAASVSGVPGWFVIGAVVLGYLTLFALALLPDASVTSETVGQVDLGDMDTDE